jgi:MFS family permease
MKNEYISNDELSRELEETYLINMSESKNKSNGSLSYLQSIIDLEGLKSFQFLTGFALGLVFLLYGILGYEFNILYPALNKVLNLSGTQKEFINISFTLGDIIGAFISQYLSKFFGRRNSILAFSGILMVTSCIVVIFTNIVWICICRFISGFSISVNYSLIIPTFTEFLPTFARELVSLSFYSFLRLGIIFYVLVDRIFYYPEDNMVRYFNEKNDNWRYALYLPALVSIFSFITNTFAVKETPRYLFLNGNHKEGVEVIKEVYKRQSTGLDFDRIEREAENFAEESKSQSSFSDLFGENYLRLTLIACLILLCGNICNISNNYSLPLILNFEISNFWQYIILQQAVAMIAHIPASFLAHNVHIGRKYTILIGFSGSAIISLVTLFFSNGIEISSPIMNFFIVLFGAVAKLYINEAFPTKLRVEAISFSFSIGRVGDFLAIILSDLTHKVFNYGPMLVIFLASIIGGTCSLFLRIETSNRALDMKR